MARAAKGQLSASAQQHPCREEHPRGGGVPQETGREAQQYPDTPSSACGGKGDRSCGSRAAAGAGASLARSISLVVPWFFAQTACKHEEGASAGLTTEVFKTLKQLRTNRSELVMHCGLAGRELVAVI